MKMLIFTYQSRFIKSILRFNLMNEEVRAWKTLGTSMYVYNNDPARKSGDIGLLITIVPEVL